MFANGRVLRLVRACDDMLRRFRVFCTVTLLGMFVSGGTAYVAFTHASPQQDEYLVLVTIGGVSALMVVGFGICFELGFMHRYQYRRPMGPRTREGTMIVWSFTLCLAILLGVTKLLIWAS